MKWVMEDIIFRHEEAWRFHMVSRLHTKHKPHQTVSSSEDAIAIIWTCSSLFLLKASFNKRCISFFNSFNKDLCNCILIFELSSYGCHFQIWSLAALTVNAWELLFETLSSILCIVVLVIGMLWALHTNVDGNKAVIGAVHADLLQVLWLFLNRGKISIMSTKKQQPIFKKLGKWFLFVLVEISTSQFLKQAIIVKNTITYTHIFII